MYNYKVKWCPICNQGWVEIVKDIETGELFCCCSECENEWYNPEIISKEYCNTANMFGQVCEPEEKEIIKRGWMKFVIQTPQLSHPH